MAENRHGDGENDPVTMVKQPRPQGASASRLAQAEALPAEPPPPPPVRAQPLDTTGLPAGAVNERDRYIERSVLGEGGMGRIHLCHDSRIGRDVAMKVLRQRYSRHPDTV